MTEKKPGKMNSRWRKGAQRYSSKTTVEDRRMKDAPTEVRFCERAHEAAGWRHGAKIRSK